jgi:hypothetical protein
MKMSKLITGLAALALSLGAASQAHAGYVVLDGWGYTDSSGSVSDIGRLNLVSGSSTVLQEVDSSGNAFVGAKFSEAGAVYSISYTKENSVGAGDSGLPTSLIDGLTISFTNVTGVVTSLNSGGGFTYSFLSGGFTISNGTNTATGSIVGIGGKASSTSIIGGINGDSTLLAALLSLGGFTFVDNTATDLTSSLLSGDVLFEAVTNNNTTGVNGSGLSCGFTTTVAGDTCTSLQIASAGDAYLVRNIPEPGSLALLGLGLFGVASSVNRRRTK